MDLKERLRPYWQGMRRRVLRALVTIRARVPYGLRSVLGVLLCIGGVFAILPVLGLWMLPLGILVIGLDVSEYRQRRRGITPLPPDEAKARIDQKTGKPPGPDRPA